MTTAVLFDLDHTLLDSDASLAAAYAVAAAAGGVEDPAAARPDFERINDALWRSVERGEISPNEVRQRRFEELLRFLGEPGDVTSVAAVMAEAFVDGLVAHGELLPGARELLDELVDRPLGLVTNGIGSVQRGRLERLGLADTFDVVAISGELGTAKPGSEIFEHALDRLSVAARNAVMIGDNWGSDIRGAAAAGVHPIWFNPSDAALPPDPTGVTMVRRLDEVAAVIAQFC